MLPAEHWSCAFTKKEESRFTSSFPNLVPSKRRIWNRNLRFLRRKTNARALGELMCDICEVSAVSFSVQIWNFKKCGTADTKKVKTCRAEGGMNESRIVYSFPESTFRFMSWLFGTIFLQFKSISGGIGQSRSSGSRRNANLFEWQEFIFIWAINWKLKTLRKGSQNWKLKTSREKEFQIKI